MAIIINESSKELTVNCCIVCGVTLCCIAIARIGPWLFICRSYIGARTIWFYRWNITKKKSSIVILLLSQTAWTIRSITYALWLWHSWQSVQGYIFIFTIFCNTIALILWNLSQRITDILAWTIYLSFSS